MFGKYKQAIFNTLANSYSNKKLFKESFNKTMDSLKDDKVLREFFVAYGNIEGKSFTDNARAEKYLNEIVSVLKDKKSQLNYNNLEESTNNVYKNLDTLIFKSNVGNIDNVIDAKESLIEHMTREVKDSTIDKAVSSTIFNHIATKKYNEKYSTLSEEDRTKLKQFLSMNESEIKEYTNNLKGETLAKLNTIKEDTDKTDMKEKIQSVMEGVTKSGSDLISIVKMENLNKSLIK